MRLVAYVIYVRFPIAHSHLFSRYVLRRICQTASVPIPEPDPLDRHLCWCQVDRTSSTVSVSEFELIAPQLFASRLQVGSDALVPCRCLSDSQLLSTCPTFVRIAPVTLFALSVAPVLTVLGWSSFLSQGLLANVTFIYHLHSSDGLRIRTSGNIFMPIAHISKWRPSVSSNI